jgi:uncharacterized protein with LGFP repeats
MNRHRSTDLIQLLASAAQWLAPLPEAVELIADKAKALRWAHTGDGGTLERFADGYVRKYKSGCVIWSGEHGAHAVSGEIEEFWASNKELLNFPEGDPETAQQSPLGMVGIRQAFADITVYSSRHGVYAVDRTIMECYEVENGSAGWLGFPIDSGTGDPRDIYVQRFEGGAIFWWVKVGPYAVRQEIVDELIDGPRCFPVSKEVATASLNGISGTVQSFRFSLNGSWHATAIYWSSSWGTVIVAPQVWSYYEELGREGSWLGFPKAGMELQRGGRIRDKQYGSP